MAVTMKQVRAALEVEEPKYSEVAKLGGDALPHLRKLVADENPLLASKATYLAGLIDAKGSGDVVAQAAQSDHVVVRVAAANSAQHVSDADAALFEGLLADNDAGVRKAAVKAIGSADRGDLKPLVQQLAQGDTAEPIRDLAAATAKTLK
jgi:HEAT repeat protein